MKGFFKLLVIIVSENCLINICSVYLEVLAKYLKSILLSSKSLLKYINAIFIFYDDRFSFIKVKS